MSQLDDPTEIFKQAVTSTMRAISGNKELTVSFGRGKPYIQGNRARVPLPESGLSIEQLAALRGTADRFALRDRYHDEGYHRRHRPRSGVAQEVFESMCPQCGGIPQADWLPFWVYDEYAECTCGLTEAEGDA